MTGGDSGRLCRLCQRSVRSTKFSTSLNSVLTGLCKVERQPMLEGVILACKLGRLEGARKRIYARYERLTRSAFNKKDEAALAFEQHMRINEIDDAVQQLQNNHLIRVAHKYRLVVPPLDEKRGSWEESGFTGK